jgi:hypothetical protein
MGAGESAHHEATRSRLEALEYERLAEDSRAKAERYALARRTEVSVGGRLAALDELGWRVLADRRWPGSQRANVDFLLVGPGGVVVVDVKAWRALAVRDGSIFCGEQCRDEEAAKLVSLSERVLESVSLLGLTHQALWPVLVLAGRHLHERAQRVDLIGEANVAAWVARLGHRLDVHQVDEVVSILDQDFPPYHPTRLTSVRVPRLRLVLPRRETQPEALFDVTELTDGILQAALDGPIEGWMTYLHPDQLRLVGTSWSGPARVRGPAGTGKTVVGLHRATYLAERNPRKVLFVTFVKTLPRVLSALCERMSPAARANIHFTGVHRLALDVVEQSGATVRIDSRKIDTAFAGAWAHAGRGSVLTRLDERWSYWKEEIDYVIKGRGLTDFEEYADLSRLGRRTPMRSEHREAMWALYVEYERRLDLANVHDFTDALIMARDLVRDGAVADYGAVIVDEAQDLNLVGLELLYAIAGDGPDRLLIIGDGQQSVYPGGFRLSEAGISVKGRAAVLRANYRNTAEILEVAERVVAQDPYDDLEGGPTDGRTDTEARRHGGLALTVRARDQRSLEAALVTQIGDATERLEVALGDLAVLVHTRSELTRYAAVLRRAGVPHLDLADYDGSTDNGRIKLGTFKRAKGLEFKFVLLPGLREGPVERWTGESDDSYRERAERMRRELYVGMTRARDGLWLGYLTS